MAVVIRNVAILPDAVEIAYMDNETDVRGQGHVWQSHTLVLDIDAYGRLVDDFLEALQDLFGKALDDWKHSVPVSREPAVQDPDEDDDDDD